MAAPHHPTPDILAAFVHGRLSDEDITTVERHLTDCSACRDVVDRLPPDSFLQQVREAAPAQRGGTVVAASSPSLAVALEELPAELADHERYRVIRKLGQGGMGAVYLAEQRLMDRQVVLKLIHPQFLARDTHRRRFDREVSTVAKLSHPNVVQAYDAFHAGDSMVLAMEYVDGIDLAAFVEARGPLEVPLACCCLVQAAQGLQYAHEQGLVHRDIKPHNLMITRRGEVKVLDFGLALLTQPGASGGSGLTQDGMLMGTPEYLAPEQWGRPHAVDIRADLYALGCTLYFLLTGRPPFPGPGTLALLRQHADEPPPSLRAARPEVPEGLEAVYQKLMAKAPAERYATPRELARALAPFARGSTAVVPPLPAAAPASGSGTAVAGGGNETQPPVALVTPPVPTPPALSPWRRSRPPVWAIAVGVVGVIGAVLTAIFLTMRTSDAIIELEDVPADAEVRVDGKQVEIRYRDGGRAEVRVAPGARRLEVRKDGFETLGEEVTLRAGGHTLLTARLKPLPAATPRVALPLVNRKAGDRTHVSLGGELKMTFAWCPPGSFLMGSPPHEGERADGETQHRVTLTQGYWLGIHEVTQAQWQAVMRNNPSKFKDDVRPVEQVSWHDCQEFCKKLGEKTGKRFRLPTEAEWEYACRAGTTTAFHFGKTISTEQANYNGTFTYGQARKGVFRERTTPVGRYSPNAWGLHDMHGNVTEWCQDWYGKYPEGDSQDYQGPETGDGRVVRGGSWRGRPWFCRAAFRIWAGPGTQSVIGGCRVVLVPGSD